MSSINSSSLATGNQHSINVSKKIGGKEVIDSGTLISYESSDLDILINTINIKIKFIDDKKIDKSKNMEIGTSQDNAKETVIKLYNLEQAFPEGSPTALHVVNVGTDRVFLSFFITTVNSVDGTRIFHYSITVER